MRSPILGGTYLARSTSLNANRCVNFYPELVETQDGKSVGAFHGTPGLLRRLTLSGAGRGLFPTTDHLYAVYGNTFYKINTSWVATIIGTVSSNNPMVSISDNGLQLALFDGANAYYYTYATGVLAQITDADFPGGDIGQFMDGYTIFNVPGTGRFMITTTYDSSSVDALDFTTSEALPDDVVSILTDHQELIVFGVLGSQAYINTGNADFPFEVRQGGFIPQGCAAKYSPAKIDNSIFWMGSDENGNGIIWRMNGYTPLRISTHAIEFAIQGYSTISDAVGYCYQHEGHSFYVLTFPTGNATWVYDAATQLWHERQWRHPTDGSANRHRGVSHAFFNGYHCIQDHSNGKLYTFSLDTYLDDTDPLVATRAWRALGDKENPDNRPISYTQLQVSGEMGVGLTTGQGSDPQIALRYSNDGGKTWSSSLLTDMGEKGEYGQRAIWNRLGRAYDRVWEVSIADPVKRCLTGASQQVSA